MENGYYKDTVDTGGHKSIYNWTYDSCSIQTNFNRDNIKMVFSMLSYKWKLIYLVWYNQVIPYQT